VELYASCEVLHELYCVAAKLGLDLVLLEKLVALTLMIEYGLSSYFDACYAVTACCSTQIKWSCRRTLSTIG